MREMVIQAMGPDRPGLVDEFTRYLHESEANVADARMVNLRGQFALIVLVEVPAPKAEAIGKGILEVGERIGLTVTVRPLGPAGARPTGRPFRLKVSAMDQPGIVHRITHLLHRHNVNIEELETSLESGSYSGTPLFTMDLTMTVPAEVPVRQLRAELENLCDSLNCDVDLRAGE